ncbi:PEP/pyruvate-binding domain-containing protein [Planctomycetota bacterium]
MTSGNRDALSLAQQPKVLAIHLELIQYPILGRVIRERMRQQLFSRGLVDVVTFEEEVRRKAIESQRRENLTHPLTEEAAEDWHDRLSMTRDILTEFYFAVNFSEAVFRRLLEEALSERSPERHYQVVHSFNPEIAPWRLLFSHARQLERQAADRGVDVQHHLREIIVVITKGMLSDQLSFVGIAKEHLRIEDLEWIYDRRIGRGKIGGKAGGLMLARAILHAYHKDDAVDFRTLLDIPDSFFLGADVLHDFIRDNSLFELANYKYRRLDDVVESYAETRRAFLAGRFPRHHRSQLAGVLAAIGDAPVIVRSSSLLEDNFGNSFAGKYESHFCPNQGTPEENLEALCQAIKQVYASLLSPDAIAYRQQKELIDYDERMGILIQRVVGSHYRNYYFPAVAGVGFSYNPCQWSPRIDREAGFLRIVTGLGTRAVDRLGEDYARMVALSHPTLQPVGAPEQIVEYSQKQLDVIDLEKNAVRTLPVRTALRDDYPELKLIGSVAQDGDLQRILIGGPGALRHGDLVVTFEGLLTNRQFVAVVRAMLRKLSEHYRRPVDVEFAVEVTKDSPPGFRIYLLQCRQQSTRLEEQEATPPADLKDEDILIESRRMVSTGRVKHIRYVVYVDPVEYQDLADTAVRVRMVKVIHALNERLADETFILVGPGRWGSSNSDLGVPVSYADLFNARVLVEMALPRGGHRPEASYGTHFFQDLVESNIYALPVHAGEEGTRFDYDFFRGCPSVLAELLPRHKDLDHALKVIDLPAATGGKHLEIVMNARQERAVAFLTAG